MLNLQRLRRAVCEASNALRTVSEILEEERECCDRGHPRREDHCECHRHCECCEGERRREECDHDFCHEERCEEECCCRHHHHCCEDELHHPPYPPYPPFPPYPVFPPYPPFPPFPPIVISSGCGCGCQHSGQTPGVTVVGGTTAQATSAAAQDPSRSAATQAAASGAPANIALDKFPDLSNITSFDALLTLGESVAAQVRELIPSQSAVEEAQ